MIFTGIDGDKKISVKKSLFRKEWEIVQREGRKIYTVPSHRSFIKIEDTDIKNLNDLKNFLSLEIEEKFGNVLWSVNLQKGKYCLGVIKNFSVPEEYFDLDLEVFSLARVLLVLGFENASVLDIGRNKTTYVELKNGEISFYRVILKGGNYIINRLVETLNLSSEEAEKVMKEEGTENEAVRECIEEILNSTGKKDIKEKRILLSGGLSKLKGLKNFFKNRISNPFCEPEYTSAFGTSLKYVVRDCSPSFRQEEVSQRELKIAVSIIGISLFLSLISGYVLERAEREFINAIREKEKREFQKYFPNKPPVAVRDQIRALKVKETYPVMKKLEKFSEKVGEGIVIYEIEFSEGKLKVRGEAKSEEILKNINPQTIKKTPEGTFEFEVKI